MSQVSDFLVATGAVQKSHYDSERSCVDTTTREVVEFGPTLDHAELTARAIAVGEEYGEPYRSVLSTLKDCKSSPYEDCLARMERQGIKYKTLAAIAYRVGMSKQERYVLYQLAERIPFRPGMAAIFTGV